MVEVTVPSSRKRADARRNEQALLDAAARVFVRSGVDAPVREIATAAGVGMGTIYRHFPTRADLIVAVFHHQVEALAADGPLLLAETADAFAALSRWVDRFVDFLVTKHGLARVFQSDETGSAALHGYFVERLVPVLGQLLDAAAREGDLAVDVDPLTLMRGVGSICAGFPGDHHDDARRLVALLIAGLRQGPPVAGSGTAP